jgi:hypothetical protein
VARPRTDRARIDKAIRAANKALPLHAQVRNWIAAEEPFAAANGLATADGRLRRDRILARYADRLGLLYSTQEE